MLDIKLIRQNRSYVEELLRRKDPTICLDNVLSLDEQIRSAKTEAEQLKSTKNTLSKEIGQRKRTGDSAQDLMQQVSLHDEKIASLDTIISTLENQLSQEMACLPNLPLEEIPISSNPKDNVCIKSARTRRQFSFTPKNHVQISDALHLFDFVRGAKLAGSGWTTYRHLGARLEWALLQYMIDFHLSNGFEMWMIPHLVKPECMFGSGQLPKFDSQLFKIRDEDYNLYLIPTAEVGLNSLHADEIFHAAELPKKYVCYSPCFRREAGAAGSQERGLIRTHQFNKVEMFAFAAPEQSEKVFQEMLSAAEMLLDGLDLHYRSMQLVTGDMSFAAAKTVDVEVWLPGQDRYYEVSSVSLCTDYQARRSRIRFKGNEQKPELVHTLNGSGLATSRLMVALLENNQQEDGSIILPPALHPYLHGMKKLCPK